MILSGLAAITMNCIATATAYGQPPAPPGSEGLPWQVGALFTANWVLVAVGVAMMSRPSKRSEKPKKSIEGEAQ